MMQAQCHTIRLMLVKIGARIRLTLRHVRVRMSEAYPWVGIFAADPQNK